MTRMEIRNNGCRNFGKKRLKTGCMRKVRSGIYLQMFDYKNFLLNDSQLQSHTYDLLPDSMI